MNSLNKQLSYADRIASQLSICFIDINDLKKVNDTYGHEAGDELLKRVSSVLEETIRNSDLVARMGGLETNYK